MFGNRSSMGGRRNDHNRPRNENNSRKRGVRAWILLRKKKNKEYEDDRRERDKRNQRYPSMFTGGGSLGPLGVMVSGDSPPPMQTSIPPGFDIPEEMRHGKITPTNIPLTPLKSRKTNGEIPNEDIEEAVPIVSTLPSPEPQPKIEKNYFDYDHTDGKQLVNEVEDDACFVKCVYFTQQCCECTIL